MRERKAAPERSSKRRLLWSLLLALLLHVAVAWWFGRELARTVAPDSRPIIVDLIEKPPENAPLPVAPSPSPTPKVERGKGHPRSGHADATPPTPPSKGGGQGESLPRPPESHEQAEPGTDGVRLFDEHALSHSLDDWRKSNGQGKGSGTGSGDQSGGGDSDSPEAERARVSERIGQDLAYAQAKDRVASGLVDPYFQRISGDLRENWLPPPSSIGGSDGSGVGSELKNLGKSWAGANRQYAKTGSPYAEGETPTGLDNSHAYARPINGTSGFDGADFAARWNAGEFAFAGGLVIVQLTQDEKGQPVDAHVVKSSGFKAFDTTAIHAVKRAASARTAPEHGLGLGGPRIETLWKMEARMVSNTCSFVPDPTGAVGVTGGAGFIPTSIACGGTFDPSLGTAQFDRPGKTKIITRVELLAVYGGETGPVSRVQ
jgi:TonB family protein